MALRITSIKAAHMELTDAIRAFVVEKISFLERLIDPNDTSAEVDAEVEKTTKHHRQGENVFRAEFNLHIAGSELRATALQEDLYAAIDEAKDDMARQLRGHKDRQRARARGGARQVKEQLTTYSQNQNDARHE